MRSTGLLPQILQRLGSEDKAAPLSDAELQPFLSGLRRWLGVSSEAVWNACLEVSPGQPFRLHLWRTLAEISKDPDSNFTDQLVSGVALGVRCSLRPCSVMAPGLPPDADPRPLECCTSAWQSALQDLATVDELLQEELQQGWIREVPGGLPSLRAQYQLCAVGKLDLVKAIGRPPRLVVDSSVSAVTENTVLPNRSCNPTLSHLRRCLPLSSAAEDFTALVLDVSKAHRRIKIRPQDQGLLCFHHRAKLYQCLTLNFGARASSYYWSRTAGLLCRLLHRMIYVNHSLMIYVGDLICLLRKCTSPLLAALVVILLLVLKVPMSWHKASLSSCPVWIGWSIDLATFTVCMEEDKQRRLLHLLLSLLQARYASRQDVERLTGKLLWLSGLFAFLRPTLATLYALQHSGQLVMAALTPEQWSNLRPLLNSDLVVTGSIGHPSVPVGSTLLRVARLPVSELAHIPAWLPESRRVWIQVSHRHTSSVLITDEVCEVLSLWRDFLHQSTCRQSILLAPLFQCEAFADACADSSSVGLGGYVKFHSGLTRFFQASIPKSALVPLCPFFAREGNPQHFIAAWELLAQCALVWTAHGMLPLAHPNVHMVLRCDNAASEAAAWKGLSLAKALCTVLRQFSDLQRRTCISAHIEHVPGFLNVLADCLSRSQDALALGFREADRVYPPWREFFCPVTPQVSPLEADVSEYVPALL